MRRYKLMWTQIAEARVGIALYCRLRDYGTSPRGLVISQINIDGRNTEIECELPDKITGEHDIYFVLSEGVQFEELQRRFYQLRLP